LSLFTRHRSLLLHKRQAHFLAVVRDSLYCTAIKARDATSFHCLRLERTKVSPCDIIRDVSRGTPNGSALDGSACHAVWYHYFNFTAESPRIYLGASLMSLGIVSDSASATIRDRNARRLVRVRTSYSSTGIARAIIALRRTIVCRSEISRRMSPCGLYSRSIPNLHTQRLLFHFLLFANFLLDLKNQFFSE